MTLCDVLFSKLQTLPRLNTESEGTTTLNFINMKHKEQHFDIYSFSVKVMMESPNCAKHSKLLKLLFKETDFKFKCIRFLKIYALVEVDLTGLLLSSTASDLGWCLKSVKQYITTNTLWSSHDSVAMPQVSYFFFSSPLFNNFSFFSYVTTTVYLYNYHI